MDQEQTQDQTKPQSYSDSYSDDEINDLLGDKPKVNKSDEDQEDSPDSLKEEDDNQEPDAKNETKEDKEDQEPLGENDFDIDLPDDHLLSEGDQKEIAELAIKHDLSKEATQELADSRNQLLNDVADIFNNEKNKQEDQWKETLRKDKAYGGKYYNSTLDSAEKVLRRYGSKELTDVLNGSGYGSHPELIKMLARLGKTMSNDQILHGEPSKKIENKQYKDTYSDEFIDSVIPGGNKKIT